MSMEMRKGRGAGACVRAASVEASKAQRAPWWIGVCIALVALLAVFALIGLTAHAASPAPLSDSAPLSVPATFTGAITTSTIDLATTSNYTFSAADFTGKYTANDEGDLTDVVLELASGTVGSLYLNGAAYAAPTTVNALDFGNLQFRATAAGTVRYNVYAYNAAQSRFGSVTVTFSVTNSNLVAKTEGTITTIYYTTNRYTAITFSDSDFAAEYKSASGYTLSYVTFTPPSSSYGKLYYNYSSDDDYGHVVTSSRVYYYDSSPYLDDITFVPDDEFTGNAWVSYEAYAAGGAHLYTGSVRISVEEYYVSPTTSTSSGSSSATSTAPEARQNSVAYNTTPGTAVAFNSTDFQTAMLSATGYSLYYVRFGLVSSSSGMLYYNYLTSTLTGSSVSSDTRYFRGSSPDLSNVWFVPASNFTGLAQIPYTSYDTAGRAFSGTVYVRVASSTASGATANQVKVQGTKGEPVKLVGADFGTAVLQDSGVILSYVTFTLPASSAGKLYANYVSASNTGTEVLATGRFYLSSTPAISAVWFVPAAGFSGDLTIPYTAYATNGKTVQGSVVISFGTGGTLDPISYTILAGETLRFSTADFRAAARDGSNGGALSYVTFETPRAAYGSLEVSKSVATNSPAAVAEGTAYYYTRGANRELLSRVTFTPADGFDGDVTVNYTAYLSNGSAYDGTVEIYVAPAPGSWSDAEVASIAARGVVPEALLGNYGADIQRDEFTALLMNTYLYAQGQDERGATSPFQDIGGNPYAGQIELAYATHIVDGVSATEFDPEATLTREQAAKIVCGVVGLLVGGDPAGTDSSGLSFGDKAEISDWALPFVAFSQQNAFLIGDEAGNFNPQDPISREEAMALTERVIAKYNW